MPRRARRFAWTDNAAYHVLNRGHNRQTVFPEAADCETFLALLDKYRQQFAARVFHWVLMSNHFHLLLQLPDPRRLSAFMAGLTLSYVHHYRRRFGFVGHLWQGRYKAFVVQRHGYWVSCGRYIERNPI
jgi:putative transposase